MKQYVSESKRFKMCFLQRCCTHSTVYVFFRSYKNFSITCRYRSKNKARKFENIVELSHTAWGAQKHIFIHNFYLEFVCNHFPILYSIYRVCSTYLCNVCKLLSSKCTWTIQKFNNLDKVKFVVVQIFDLLLVS